MTKRRKPKGTVTFQGLGLNNVTKYKPSAGRFVSKKKATKKKAKKKAARKKK